MIGSIADYLLWYSPLSCMPNIASFTVTKTLRPRAAGALISSRTVQGNEDRLRERKETAARPYRMMLESFSSTISHRRDQRHLEPLILFLMANDIIPASEIIGRRLSKGCTL